MKQYKYNRILGKVTCNNCNIEFEKPISEIKRNQIKDRPNYCSRSCVGKKLGSEKSKKVTNRYNISNYSENRKDEYTIFKYTLKCIKQRFKEVNVTLQDLKEQWEKQNAICPYSKIQLELPTHTNKVSFEKRASLDRVDSSKGYIKENIQFIVTPINYMKSTMSHQDTVNFLQQISKNISCHQED